MAQQKDKNDLKATDDGPRNVLKTVAFGGSYSISKPLSRVISGDLDHVGIVADWASSSATLTNRKFKTALMHFIRKGNILRTNLVDQKGRSLLMLLALVRDTAAMQVMFWMGLWAHCIDHKIPDTTEEPNAEIDVMEYSRRKVRSVNVGNELKVLSEQEKSLSELLVAARTGCSDEVNRLINGCCISDIEGMIRARDTQGNSALHHACASGDVSTVKLLVTHGCNLKAANHQENNLLHATVLHGSPAVLAELLKHRAINIEEKNQADKTPAMLCAETGSIHMLQILTRAGAIASRDLVGIAASKGCLSFVKHCIKKLKLSLAYVDSKKHTVLHHACSQGSLEMVEFVLEHTERKKELLLARDHVGSTGLHVCCESALFNHKILDLLLRTAKDHGILEELVNSQDCYSGKHTCVLICGRDNGRTAYHYVQSHRSMVTLFVNCAGSGQVDVSEFGTAIKSGWGDYPSDEVSKSVDEMLITKVNHKLQTDLSPLHLAVFKEKTENVKLLLEFGAAVNLRDCFGLTPLHLAAMRGNTSMVKTLDENGADFTIEDNEHQTPLDIALLNEHKDTVNYIGKKDCINLSQEVTKKVAKRLDDIRHLNFQDIKKDENDEDHAAAVDALWAIKMDINEMLDDLKSSSNMEATAP